VNKEEESVFITRVDSEEAGDGQGARYSKVRFTLVITSQNCSRRDAFLT
jgi:hypothetical protein